MVLTIPTIIDSKKLSKKQLGTNKEFVLRISHLLFIQTGTQDATKMRYSGTSVYFEFGLSGNYEVVCPIDLPDGAYVTEMKVIGDQLDDSENPWRLDKQGFSESLATADLNAWDTVGFQVSHSENSDPLFVELENCNEDTYLYGIIIKYVMKLKDVAGGGGGGISGSGGTGGSVGG